jgi:hypothetical protein
MVGGVLDWRTSKRPGANVKSEPSRSCSSTCRVGRVIAKTPFFRAAGVRERQVQLSHTANTTMSVVVGAILMMSTHKL